MDAFGSMEGRETTTDVASQGGEGARRPEELALEASD